MALGKLDQKKFPFFRETTSAGASDIFDNYGCYGILTLEVSGATAISLKVQGCINVEDGDKKPIPEEDLEWTDMALINAGDFSVSSSASANGVYSVGISGLTKIRVVIDSVSGAATVIGVMEA